MAEQITQPTLILGIREPSLRLLVQTIAQKFSWESVVAVEKGSEAYETARKTKNPVFLLDADLPSLKGMYLCRMLKQNARFSSIPIGIVVADDEGARELNFLGIFPDVLLVLPSTSEELEESLSRLYHLASLNYRTISMPPLEQFLDMSQETLNVFFYQVHSLLNFQKEISLFSAEELLQKYVEAVKNVTRAEKIFLFLFDEDATRLIGKASIGSSPEVFQNFKVQPEGGKFLGRIVEAVKWEMVTPQQFVVEEPLQWLIAEDAVGYPLLLEDYIQCTHWWDCGTPNCCIHQKKVPRARFKTGMIEVKEGNIARVTVIKIYGAVFLSHFPSELVFSPFSQRNLKGLTDGMLGFLERSWTAEELHKQVSFLSTLQQASAWMTRSLDLPVTLQNILTTVTETLEATRGSIMLIEPDGFLRIYVATGIDREIARSVQIKPGESLAGWVFLNQKPLLIEDITDTQWSGQTPKEGYATKSALVVPLISDGEVLGVLNLADKKTGKPFTQDDLELLTVTANYAVIALKNARLYWELKESYLQTILALSQAIEAKDPYTKGHSERVALYTEITAKEMGVPPKILELLRIAGILHDVGKIGVPESILLKPGRLTEEEFKLMKKHVEYGDAIVEPIKFLSPVRAAVRSHHEWYGGGGYPDGLTGENIPLIARIMAVADAFDAMCTERKYRPALPVEKALAILEENAGVQFDPEVVKVFVSLVKAKRIPPPSEMAI
ncbi:MAG: HD domain-containing phosphohydrolase [bacterium JZ-2024 1]